MNTKIRILHIDDNLHGRQLVKNALHKEHVGFELVEADSRQKFEQHLTENDFDLVLSDYNILGFDGLQVLQIVKERHPELPVIIVTGTGSEEIAIQAMKLGAADYVIKSVKHIQNLIPTIRKVIENKKIQDEHKTTLIALRESEERFRLLFDNSMDSVLLTVPNGAILKANTAACNIFGRTEEELKQLGRNGIIDVTDPRLAIALEERSRTGKYKGELTGLRKDGTPFPIEISSALFQDSDGNPRSSIIIRDISESKQAEEALVQEQYLMYALMNNVPDSIYFKDRASRFIRISKAQAQLFCLSDPAQAVGKTDFDFFTEEHARQAYDDEQAIILSGQPLSKEEKETWADRPDTWVSTSKMPLRDKEGNIIGTFGISMDITKRKQAEETIVKERTLLKTLIDNLPSAVFVKDKDYRKIVANTIHISSMARHLSSLGLDPNIDIIGKTDFEVTSKEWAEKYFANDQKVIRDGQVQINKEEEGVSPDGKQIWLLVSKIPIRDKDGVINGMVGITTDITERKLAEEKLQKQKAEIEKQNIEYATLNEEYLSVNEELRASNEELKVARDKAEESDRLKTAFLQNMSHEIRTPMNGILGFTALLRNPGLTDVKQQEFIQLIEQSGQRMLNIINDIIDLSKIETGQIDISSKEINVNHLLKQLHAFFKPEAEGKGLNLTYKTELSDELCKIKTDETKLTRVLSTLINNALKFTKSGTIVFGYHRKEQVLEFYVQDTGIGIVPEMQEIIFERFRQVDMSIARNYEGAGLGLAISKAFVEKLAGKIWVESELGKGSTFFFNIPHSSTYINRPKHK
jgi:PAS domain S-box-containing protein